MKFFLALATLLLVATSAALAVRQINPAGLNLIKSFEGFRANFYSDSVGVKTIGYGHTCRALGCSHIHPPISKAQGETLLRQDLTSYEACVEHNFPHIDDDKFAALVSFVYNLGCGVLPKSTLKRDIDAHNFKGAAAQFGAYVHAGGKVLQGLVRRRAAERALFCRSGGC